MYVDPFGIQNLTASKALSDEDKLREVSKQFESVFLSQLMREMRGSVESNGLLGEDSMASKMFREMWDNAVVQSASERSSFGLADMVYEQLAAMFLNKAADGESESTASNAHKFDMLLKNLAKIDKAPGITDELTAQGLSQKI